MTPFPTPEEFRAALRLPGQRQRFPDVAPPSAGTYSAAHEQADASAADQMDFFPTLAQGLRRGLDLRDEVRASPEFHTAEARWAEGSDRILDQQAQSIRDPDLRDRCRTLLGSYFSEHHDGVRSDAAAARAAFGRALIALDRKDLIDTLGLEADPLHNAKIDVHNALIDSAERRGDLDAEAAQAQKRHTALAITGALYGKMAREDPTRAITELSGETPGQPLLKHLPDDLPAKLLRYAEANRDAQDLDSRRAVHLAHQNSQRASDDAESTVLSDLLGDAPTVTAKDIVNHVALNRDAMDRLIGVAARRMEPDPPAELSNSAAVDLIDRIRRPEGHPERIAGIGPLIEAYNAGTLGSGDLAFVARELADSGSRIAATWQYKSISFDRASRR